MRRPALAMALLAVVVLGPGGARAGEKPAARAQERAPRIAIQPARFDFGRVLPGRTLVKEFTIRNHGRGELVIEEVSTTCGCTAALPGSTTVRPGRSTPLKVTLDTLGEDGRISRSVLVRSNDPARATLEVKLEATVVKPEAKEE